MISSYRLGDLVLVNLTESEQNEILADHPDSFGAKFILKKKQNTTGQNTKGQNTKEQNIDIITKIAVDYIENNLELFPPDIQDSTVVHLRLGDVVAGGEGHEKSKRPFHPNYILKLLNGDTNKKYIIGKCFFAKPSSTNYEECIKQSKIYLDYVINITCAEYFEGINADMDLCFAVKSKKFVQGRGFFSKLIVLIRKKLNLENIETVCYDESRL
jgi:hypothetical protein